MEALGSLVGGLDLVDPKAFGGLLRAVAGYEGAPETRATLELLALTFVRPGEPRAAEWAELDLDAGVWATPAEKTKMKRVHRVPLAPRAVAILRELHIMTGHGKFLLCAQLRVVCRKTRLMRPFAYSALKRMK